MGEQECPANARAVDRAWRDCVLSEHVFANTRFQKRQRCGGFCSVTRMKQDLGLELCQSQKGTGKNTCSGPAWRGLRPVSDLP